MSQATDLLSSKAKEYRDAMMNLGQLRRSRDEAKLALKDIESSIFYEKVTDGTIDGRNAETREAQTQNQFKLNAKWQAASSLARHTEELFQQEQDNVNVILTELRVTAILVNVEIAEKGSSKLLAEVTLAGA